MNDWDLIDEELLRDAGELPRASQRLRRRVLRAARQAGRRKRLRRRLVIAASLLLPPTILATWYQTTIARHGATETGGSHRAAAGLPQAAPPAPADAWDEVDASISERRRNSEAIRSSLY